MTYQESIVALTEEEKEAIRKEGRSYLIPLPIIWVGSIIFYSLLFGSSNDDDIRIFLLFWVLGFGLMPLGILGNLYYQAYKDLQIGNKKVIRGTIDEKIEEVKRGSKGQIYYYYFFKIGEKKVEVGGEFYAQHKVHENIAIDSLLATNKVIKVQKL
jgi:hypothetical protein